MRPKIHVACSSEPLVPGGSLITKCGLPLHKSYVVRLILKDEMPDRPWQMCNECWNAIWDGTYNTLVCDADSAPDLVREGTSDAAA